MHKLHILQSHLTNWFREQKFQRIGKKKVKEIKIAQSNYSSPALASSMNEKVHLSC